jgi:hypothetical protein
MDFAGTTFKVKITAIAATNMGAAGGTDITQGQYLTGVSVLSFAKAKEAPIKLTGQGSRYEIC